jgi:hypothetical protein
MNHISKRLLKPKNKNIKEIQSRKSKCNHNEKFQIGKWKSIIDEDIKRVPGGQRVIISKSSRGRTEEKEWSY